jgi:hypothetical protein
MEQTELRERVSGRNVLSVAQMKDAWFRSEPAQFGDPILAHTRLNHHAMFHPLGFPVSVTTNSEAVLDAAQEGWGCFSRRFDATPVRLKVAVAEDECWTCPPTPACRMRDHIVTNIADSDNFAATDLSSLFATICVTGAAVRHRDYLRYFFLDSTALGCIGSAHATAIHAGCVALDDVGILLCGESGAGKTTLSYACARAGWTYVTDDGSYLVHGSEPGLITGNCCQARFRPSAGALFPLLRGREVMRRAGVGKPSIELPIMHGKDIRTSETARARYMVFLERNVDKEELVPFPRAVARMYLWQTVQCMPYETERHLKAIDALLDAETFELHYNSLDWAIERLTQLVREGR